MSYAGHATKKKRKRCDRKACNSFMAEDVKRITDENDFSLESPLNSKYDVVYGK